MNKKQRGAKLNMAFAAGQSDEQFSIVYDQDELQDGIGRDSLLKAMTNFFKQCIQAKTRPARIGSKRRALAVRTKMVGRV